MRVVGLLSEILRSCLDETRGQEAPLADELKLVESYLEIQRIRFADRLTIDVDADADALSGAHAHARAAADRRERGHARHLERSAARAASAIRAHRDERVRST